MRIDQITIFGMRICMDWRSVKLDENEAKEVGGDACQGGSAADKFQGHDCFLSVEIGWMLAVCVGASSFPK